MSSPPQPIVCRQCGRGFVEVAGYRDFLARRGMKVTMPVQCMTCFLREGPLPKQQGNIKWFDPRKHYGFIITAEGEEIFFHQQQIFEGKRNAPHEGQTVLFHVQQASKGPEAINVELA